MIELTGRDYMPPYRSHNYKPDTEFRHKVTGIHFMLEYNDQGEAMVRRMIETHYGHTLSKTVFPFVESEYEFICG